MEERIINVSWEGPILLSGLDQLCDAHKDKGLYQIYGHHPVYGPDVLLYIGKAREQTFGQRIKQEKLGNEDPSHVEVYVGRILGPSPPLDARRREIDLAEKLLIHAHGPAYNSQQISAVSEDDPEVRGMRVFNWGRYRSLNPEVSGRRWTTASTAIQGLAVYQWED